MLSERSEGRFFGYYPGTVALVTAEQPGGTSGQPGDTSGQPGSTNVMAAGWHTALSTEPPLYGVAVGRERATHPLVLASGRFGINLLPAAHARAVQGSGLASARDFAPGGKAGWLGLDFLPGSPLAIAQAYLCYECELTDVLPVGDHDLFVGRVRVLHHDPEAFDERWLLREKPAVYLGRSAYVTTAGEREEFPPGSYPPVKP